VWTSTGFGCLSLFGGRTEAGPLTLRRWVLLIVILENGLGLNENDGSGGVEPSLADEKP